jgi:hypothetical protein
VYVLVLLPHVQGILLQEDVHKELKSSLYHLKMSPTTGCNENQCRWGTTITASFLGKVICYANNSLRTCSVILRKLVTAAVVINSKLEQMYQDVAEMQGKREVAYFCPGKNESKAEQA